MKNLIKILLLLFVGLPLAIGLFPLTVTVFISYLILKKAKFKPVFKYSLAALLLLLGVTGTNAMYKNVPTPPNQKVEQTAQVQPTSTVTPELTPEPTPAVMGEKVNLTPTKTIPTQTPVTPLKSGVLVKVVRVIDGDTIEIEGGKKVRYIGIDTPETVHPEKPVQCFGVEASNKNKELVDGKTVELVKDVSETDKYGRLLRYVWVGDIFVNDYLVRQGYAYAYTYPPDVKYQEQLRQAQQEAMANNRGLWSACPVVAPITTAPTPTSAQTSQTQTNCVIKGNISSSGEKIYHLPGCASYNVTKIDTSRGERWFCSEPEALAAGWRKAKNCP